jgi:TetR/AcrR family transcriptional repressor of mexJK operon
VQSNDNSRREDIKTAAKQLFFHFGLTKTSMDEIAKECKLAKPSLYYYYPSKEAIFNEVVIDEARKFIDKVERKIPPHLPADEKIAFFFSTLYHDLKKYAKALTHLPESLYENYPHGRPIVEKINEFMREKIRPLLEEGQKNKVLKIKDEESTLSALVVMTDFLNLEWMRRIDEKEGDKIIEQAIEIITNGIRRRNTHD